MAKLGKEEQDFIKRREPDAKLRHIDACLLIESQYKKSAGFNELELLNEASAELNFKDISLLTTFLKKQLAAPLMIAPMTGGFELGAMLNRRWALAAKHFNIAMGVGSQRLALEDPSVAQSFLIRKYAKDIFLFANIGISQLLSTLNEEHAKKTVDMIDANALFIHLNPMQEACQENGDTNFSGALKAIEKVVKYLEPHGIYVFVREVGFGLSQKATKDFLNTGITGIDCAGAGGTSWAKVESLCTRDEKIKKLGQTFAEWGIPTARSIMNVRTISKDIPLIATGGIRSGLDVAKSLALGANLSAMAMPLLKHAIDSEQALFSFIEQTLLELKMAMFASGCSRVCDLKQSLLYSSKH